MNLRVAICGLLLSAALLAVVIAVAAPPAPKANLNELSLEIAALQTLHELELTRVQLSALAKLAKESAPEGEQRQAAKASPECAKAIADLHAALSRGDDNRIAECHEKLDAIMEKEEPELDNGITVTEGAMGNAADALKILNVRQLGAFLGTLELTDPAEYLTTAMETVRKQKAGKEADQEIATIAEEAAWLLNGDDDSAQKTKDKVSKLLQRVARIKNDAAFAAQRKEFEKEVREIIGDVDNMTVIGNILEHGMAELLSNPRLEAAIRIQSRATALSRPKTTAAKSAKGK